MKCFQNKLSSFTLLDARTIKYILIGILMTQSVVFAQSENIKVQLRWRHQFQFAGFYAALHKGFYKQENLNISLIEGGPSINAIETVLTKKAEIGVSNSSLVLDFLNNKPVVNLGSIMQHSPNILVTHKEYKSPVDLARNATIALMGGDQDVELKAMFLKEGIDLSKINFVQNDNHLNALIRNEVSAINAYSSNEPYLLKSLNVDYSIIEPRRYGLDFYGDTLFASKEFVNQHRENVEKFRQATFKGWLYALRNQDEIIELILKKYNTQNKTREQLKFEAKALYKIINPELVKIGHCNPGRWEHIVENYKLFGLINRKKNLQDFYYKYNDGVDWKEFYLYTGLFFSIIFTLFGILLYILLINKKIKRSLQRQTILFENSASAGIVWKRDFTITGWNTQAQKLFGWTKEEILGKNMFEFFVPQKESSQVTDNLHMVMKENENYVFLNQNNTKSGRIITCEWHNTLLPQINNEEQEIVAMAIDVTQKEQEEKILKKKAHYDPLTSLPNRDYFETLLSDKINSPQPKEQILSVGFIDLDHFKEINDTLGHDSGDYLLKTVSKRFQNALKEKGFIGRVGGDEFIFFTDEQTHIKSVTAKLLSQASSPVEYEKTNLKVSASIGVYTFRSSSSQTLSEIFKKADTAMYQAKKNGKNRCHAYSD